MDSTEIIGYNGGRVEVGQSVYFSCVNNTRLPGNLLLHLVKCQTDGEWDSEPPVSGCDGEVILSQLQV